MSRRELKEQAKAALFPNFGNKMLLLIIPILLGIGGGAKTVFQNFSRGNLTHNSGFNTLPTDTSNNIGAALPAILLVVFIGLVIGLLIGIVIGALINAIWAGGMFAYLRIFRKEEENPAFSSIFRPFSDGMFWKITGLYVLQLLVYIGLILIPIIGWAFLIYLALGWSQSLYILYDKVENGEYIGVGDILRSSAKMMAGRRMNYFVFQLSFIWWYLLSGVTGGLATVWTTPYITMSTVAYYENL
jgi:uncharacterized membrane protein